MCADTPEYKDTLNLPKTDFPMRAGLPNREPAWLEKWATMGIYDRLRDKAARAREGENGNARKPFTLHDGPPYANGHLHIGHALNKILKDMVVRSQQMMGRDARYIPGWDCHGLPIEWKIEEQYRAKGLDKDEVDVVAFRQECRKFAEGWIDIQRDEFKRLGITGTWDKPYLTMDYRAERIIAEEFQKFLMTGTLYQGSKPVMWSPVEKTALAEAEIEYHDHKSHTIWVPFKATNGEGDLQGVKVVIWTTTPWTIPSNKAVAYGNDIAYGLYEVTGRPEECWARIGDRYLLADTLAEDVLGKARLEPSMYRRLRDVSADELGALTLAHPFRGLDGADGFWDYDVPMIDGDHVTDDAGTGFVHTAPSHGQEDYEAFVARGWMDRMTHNVGEESEFLPHVPFFADLKVLDHKGKEGKANTAVIDKLVEAGGLLARGRMTHSYPHSWRSKAPVIYRNTPQWFAAIDRPVGDGQDDYGNTIRERALNSIDQLVKWTPQTGRNRLYSMIEARPDWVLSRQRAWGVPLTCFVKKGALPTDADFLLKDEQVNARVLEAFEAEGADAWYKPGAKERFLGNDYDPSEWEQVFDILDVWFDSGSTHAFVLRDREDGSEDGLADLYLEGTDQHRGWFHSSMLQSCGTQGRAPYRGVLTHGFTLDEKGNKMSKSLGNTVAPEDVTKQYGADILRLWVAQADYTADLRIGPEILKGVADSYRRLRNTMRYMLGALSHFEESDRVEPADMPELERYVLHRLAELDEVVRNGYDSYDFQGVFQQLFNFCTVELSAFYFDIRKDALYCDGDTQRRRAARTVMDILFHRLTTWLAPVLVFTMEDVWLDRFPGEDSSIHLQDIPETPASWKDEALAGKFRFLKGVRNIANAMMEHERIAKKIGASLEAKILIRAPEDEQCDLLRSIPFDDFCIVSDVIIEKGRPVNDDGTPFGPNFEGVGVKVLLADGEKCQRCWKILPDVGTHQHPGTCQRCNDALG